MNRLSGIFLFLIVLVLLSVTVAGAQITITSTDLQNILLNSQRMQYHFGYFPYPVVDLGSPSGSSQTFDFSGLPPEDSRDTGTMEFVSPAGQPGAAEFPTSNLCMPIVLEPFPGAEISFVTYFLIQSDGFYELGTYSRQYYPPIIDTTVIQKNSQPQIQIPLPLSYGMTRMSIDTVVSDSANGDFDISTTSVTCDGWGDLTVPVVLGAGAPKTTLLNCLRATETEIVQNFIGGSLSSTGTYVSVIYITADGTLLSVDQPDTDYTGGNADVTDINYSYRLGGATDVRQSSPALPEGFGLLQNYPNPFNPSTVIAFTVPSTGHVSLRVFDMLGREVANLADRVMSPGTYEATFDAATLPSGMYIYKLVSGSYTATKKMNIVK